MQTYIATIIIIAIFMLALSLNLLIRGRPAEKKCCTSAFKNDSAQGGGCGRASDPGQKSDCCA